MFLARSITTPYALQRASMLAYRHRSALTSPVEATCYKLSSSDGKFVQESQFCPSSIEETIGNMRVLFLTNSFNSMAQRAYLELTDTYMTDVHIEFAIDEKQLIKSVKRVNPDVIICPFLTKRIPEAIWRNQDVPCLVMHPGIRGDRGASSIDWALKKNIPEWGVTVLQADEEMDAGAIWSTKNFQVTPDITKSGMYAHLVVDSAMECLHEVLAKVATGDQGTPLDYNDPEVKGTLRPNMKLYDRTVDFNASADNVASTIRYSDSAPGASADFDGHKVFLYNVHVDKECKSAQALSGTITGKLNGAVRIACASGSVWVTHMKGRGKDTRLPQIKLPATDVLPQSIVSDVPEVTKPDIFANLDDSPYVDVWVSIEEEVAVISFPFLNGAMSTDQCNRLTECFQETIQRPDVKVVVLAGGGSAWSNGINLNTIEAASDPADESWRNINAINDFVKAVFSAKDKVTVAALQGNAGAGGAMAALACDLVWAHGNTVLNPHYKSIGLYGSEYWTHFLPRRVGSDMALELTERCMPVSAKSAKAIGMIDAILSPSRNGFMEEVMKHASILGKDQVFQEKTVSAKNQERCPEWHQSLELVRSQELRIMRENFVNPEYIRARKAFVHKFSPTATPVHLLVNQGRPQMLADTTVPTEKVNNIPAVRMGGIKVSKALLKDLAVKVELIMETSNGDVPTLAVVIVSGNACSEHYVRNKVKAAKKAGILTETYRFENNSDTSRTLEEILLERIRYLNNEKAVNGIMVQLPLPAGVNKHRVLAAVSPEKDVDGLVAANLGSLALGTSDEPHTASFFTPCTAKGIMALLDYYHSTVLGKKVCIIGRSSLVGMPTQLCLMKRGATVTNCDINTVNLKHFVRDSDIVIASAGSPELVKKDWIKPGAIVVDAGYHVLESKNSGTETIVGDVESGASQVASLMTPVPGGVGPMTVTMLLENTVDAFISQNAIDAEDTPTIIMAA